MRKIDLNNFQVATSETARDINRRVVLNLIRQHQPISRADLARQSGLQRSTVSLIIEQLINDRWVTEGAIGAIPRGRKPRFLHLNNRRAGIIGVNIRPVNTTIGLADFDARFMVQESFATPLLPAQFIQELTARILKMIQANPEISYEGIGMSLPGRVDAVTQKLVFAPNLGWQDIDLKTPIEAATGLSVELENAANACALAEFWFGNQAESVQNLIALTVSEGIGAGIIANGQLFRGVRGLGGEFGHVTLHENGLPCRCGNQGCWEVYASNSAVLRYYSQSSAKARKSVATEGHANAALGIEDVIRLAEKGDAQAVQAFEQMARQIGTGLAMLVTGLAPEVILLIGECTRVWSLLAPIIEAEIKQRCFSHAAPRIVATNPAEHPRLRGTIALVLQKHFGAPEIA